ncbi:MAG: ABC transporter permease [Phenylobacterium sp.]|nr:MAG: ABC transporter permease [Phenylobacterium sp.]
MTNAADAMDPAALDPPARPAPAKTRPFYWSVRRELWENRSLHIAPLAVAAICVVGFVISAIGLPERRQGVLALAPAKQATVISQPYDVAAVGLMLTGFVLAIVYCLGALHGERRDRSLLFWKSLPVSDLTTVAAKISIPLAVLPVITFVMVIATQLVMLLWTSVLLVAHGMSPASTRVDLIQGSVVLAYGLVTCTLWYAPLYAWLLMVSGWARRVPFLWAVLPPLGVALLEKLAIGTTHVGNLLLDRLAGGFDAAYVPMAERAAKTHQGIPQISVDDLDPGRFLTSPSLWAGLVLAAAFLAVTVWLRRRREPI